MVQFSSSGEHTYAIDNQGKLLAWGRNEDGELGSEDGINRSVPLWFLCDTFSHHGSLWFSSHKNRWYRC
ncbi:hypothetical protein [Paenibacillus polymyxa]|uniref:hypothetical protein n=1 Tax=Paenibacillus polymyxa TaxID=1406 RepID=UPI0009B812AC